MPSCSQAETLTRTPLTHGGRLELERGDTDRVTVRDPSGEVVLRIELGADGPILRLSAAHLELAASEAISMVAPKISVSAGDRLRLSSGGDMVNHVGRHEHRRVGGEARLEAASVATQTHDGDFAVQATGEVRLDGTFVALNDDPAPNGFPWASRDEGEEP
ncbi:MAG: hypothetical protein KC731_42745 [Myxococcales bacterium]|nr:hypothetical protein [Myxococcales bacterium]